MSHPWVPHFCENAGAKWGNLEDVDHLHLKLHPIVYSNKTYSAQEFLLRLRKDVIMDLLSQVNRNFSNLGAFLQQSVASLTHLSGDMEEEEEKERGPSEVPDLPDTAPASGLPST